MEEHLRKYWVGFNIAKGIGPARLRALLDYFGDLETAWQAPAVELRASGLGEKIVENFLQLRKEIDLELICARMERLGVRAFTWDDPEYPRRLKEIDSAPPVLYVKGEFTEQDQWAVAVVGTRRITTYGRQVTQDLVTHLAQNGVTVVSGLARGVDTIAHQTALKAGGRTIAVLGSGVDQIYPPENRALVDELVGRGAVVSDYPLGTSPDAINFPPRNRIISGLSLATVVVEAGVNSGALITADFAVEQGREVLAVPGNINAPQSRGTNRLIQMGAKPLLDPRDVLEVLNLTRVTQYQAAQLVLPESAAEAQLLDLLRLEPVHVDEICNQLNLPVKDVSATLALMELKGMVRQVGGMNYISVRENQAGYSSERGISDRTPGKGDLSEDEPVE